MPIYQVISRLNHNGLLYSAGQVVELTEQEAASLLKLKSPPIERNPISDSPAPKVKALTPRLLPEDLTQQDPVRISQLSVSQARLVAIDSLDIEEIENWLLEEEANSNRKSLVAFLRSRIEQVKQGVPF